MNYNVRISDNFLRGDHVDGEVLQHTDLNELEDVTKTAINANYEDIQKLQNGDTLAGNSEQLSGATLSKFATETLQNSDTKVPTSAQVKQYVDGEISNIDMSGYYTKREIDDKIVSATDEDDSTDKTYSTKYINENKVNYTDYATDETGGTVKISEDYGTYVDDDGTLKALNLDYGDYENWDDETFVSKGTLDNVLENKPIVLVASGPEVSEAINLNTDLDEGIYLLVGYVVYGNSFETFYVPSLVAKSAWSSDIMKITFYDRGVVAKVKRTASGASYTYTTLGEYKIINESDLTDYVKFTNYPSSSSGIGSGDAGVIRASSTFGLSVKQGGTLAGSPKTSAQYSSAEPETIICKTTLDNILTDYVKNTNYATASKAGVIKSGYYGLQVDGTNGKAYCDTYTYANYGNVENQRFISKGTLENVITGKGLVSNTDYATTTTPGIITAANGILIDDVNGGKTYGMTKSNADYNSSANTLFISKGTLENVLTARIGDIQTLLDNLDTGSGV